MTLNIFLPIRFRLATLDHGQFSFVDQDHRKWPLISVTNPKNALFVMPQKENLQSIIQSTHVRILAFSLSQIRSVHMQINYGPWKKCRHVKGPLYVAKWNATKYSTGLHYIQVSICSFDSDKVRIIIGKLFATGESFGRGWTRRDDISTVLPRWNSNVLPRSA